MIPITCVADFVEAICCAGVLSDAQCAELHTRLGTVFAEPVELSRELVRRRWLSRYQSEKLILGRGAELLLGPYLLLDRLGEGGMGQVYKAHHRPLDRVVALKVIRREVLDNATVVARFLREVRATAQLAHPHIVRAIDADQIEGAYYLAMEYVEGHDLARIVKRDGPLPVAQACDYVRQVALGLQHAHEQGLVHRDIKPGNLIVKPVSREKHSGCSSATLPRPYPHALRWGVVKILDLGLARLLGTNDRLAATQLTLMGAVMGTPDYLSPEQAVNSHQCDIRSDLYSLGCTWYYLLGGRPPFPDGTLTEKLLKHQFDEPESVEEVRRARLSAGAAKQMTPSGPGIPSEVVALMRKLMAKRPEDRFATPAELVHALTEVVLRSQARKAARRRAASAPCLALPTPTLQKSTQAGDQTLIPETAATTQRIELPSAPRRANTRLRAFLVFGGFFVTCLLTGWLCWLTARFAERSQTSEPEALFAPPADPAREAWTLLRARVQDRESDPATLRRDLIAFRTRHYATPYARDVATVFAELPAPLDRASAAAIPKKEMAWGFPRELVAVLGQRQTKPWVPVLCLAFSPDGETLACGGADQVVRLWDMGTLRERKQLAGHRTRILTLAYAPDGKTLASGGEDGVVHLWSAAVDKPRVTLQVAKQGLVPLAFTPDGQSLVTGGADGTIRLWDVATGEPRHTGDSMPGRVLTVAVSPDGQHLASGHEDGVLRLWQVSPAGVQPAGACPAFAAPVRQVAFRPDGATLIGGGGDGILKVFAGHASQMHERGLIRGHRMAFAPHRCEVATTSPEKFLRLWDPVACKVLRESDSRLSVNDLAFAPEGRHLACAVANGTVHVLRLQDPPKK